MPLPEIQNEMILASAGSGKTYQLTNRFIGLMAAGVAPERIIALTFTRKAAGEFFQAILEKLADAATDRKKCEELSESIGIPELSQKDFLHLIARLVANMHRLSLGTLDSFFVRIIQAFPFEFGLGGGFEIIGDHELAKAKSRVYRKVFNRGANAQSRAQFLQSFKESTFGQEEASLVRVLDRFIEDHHELFLEAPDASRWGNPKTIWPDPDTGWIRHLVPLGPPLARLFEIFDKADIADRHRKRWDAFREAILVHQPGTPIAPPISYLLEKLVAPDLWQDLQGSLATLSMERAKQELSPAACKEICTIVRSFIAGEFESKMRRTAGIWDILNQYESEYSQAVRRRGKLTFFDLQLILSGHARGDSTERIILSQTPDEETRLQIDYRLDARFDHWLLDEFQDTNFHQWSVVQNLIDEAVQDTSDQRSLFVVGDIKQAIYAWRGGDVRLFKEIYDHYNQNGERILKRPLNDSWRSGPAVIEMVNQVFGARETLTELFPKEAIDRWDWDDHHSRKQELTGCACLLSPPAVEAKPAAGLSERKTEARHRVLLEILDSIRPADNGLSCAVLVQSNRQCHLVTDFIRANSTHRVFDESDTTVVDDSPAAGALLALLRFAAHPGDTFASHHVKMTPLAGVIEKRKLSDPAMVRRILRDVSDHGFEHFFRTWLRHLQLHTEKDLDPFNLRRVEQLAEAAQMFDTDGDRDIDAFLEFARSFSVRDTVAAGVIQVMTVHKSKGLGFDVVILPELQGNSLAQARDGIGVKRKANREIQWILELPSKDIANVDPQFRHYRESQEADACYEELCKLYVAMTRAKRAMYVITDEVSDKSSSHNFPKLLKATLSQDSGDEIEIDGVEATVVYATGDPDWHRTLKPKPAKQPPPEGGETKFAGVFSPRPHLPRRTPSGSESHTVSAYELFSRRGKRAREFGTAVHALFECIEWSDGLTEEGMRALFESAPIPEDVRSEAEEQVISFLSDEGALRALSKPAKDAKCWLEKKFELVLEGEWISGTFDRAVIESDRATVQDFKTDHIASEEALDKAVNGYLPQLRLYRRVLSRLTGLPMKAIRCQLLFTRLHRVVDVNTSGGSNS